MFQEVLPDIESALGQPSYTLCSLRLVKGIQEAETDDAPWKFKGIASDESEDVEGDTILKKTLDLSYAQKRGYVNWDHQSGPADQLGYLTNVTLIDAKKRAELEIELGQPLEKGASVYVEGVFYKDVEKAKDVRKIMNSTPDSALGLGLSLEGSIARDTLHKNVVKAFVRGVAVTPVPAQPNTLLKLKKSLRAYGEIGETDFSPDLPKEIADLVFAELAKSSSLAPRDLLSPMSHDEATLWLLKKKPHYTYKLASQVVQYAIQQKRK